MILTSLLVYLSALGCFATPTVPKYDTIVVGLGSAGATAASTLARAGRRVLALDAQSRVGGRVRTENLGDGVVELGAEWIHGLSPSRVYDAAVQNNISVLEQDLPVAVYRADGSGPDPVLKELFDYCAQFMDEGSDRLESTGQLIERKLRQYLAETKPELLKDEQRLKQFLATMEQAVNSLEATTSYYDVSAQTTYENLNGTLYGSWHRHGYRTFFEILLNTYNGGPGLPSLDIKLNKEVTSIQWSASGVRVRCADGDQYSADNVIVTVSLGVLKERHANLFSPPLPAEKVTAIETISMGLLDKIVLVFDQPREQDVFVMFYWSVDDIAALPADDRWLATVVGTSPPAGSNNTLTLWMAGDHAKFMESLPEALLRQKAVELLQRFAGPNVTVPQPTAWMRSTWFTNPFTRGSYTYDNMQMPSHPGLRDVLAAPLSEGEAPRVLFAGEATNTKHFGTVHGASESGYREAQRLLGKL